MIRNWTGTLPVRNVPSAPNDRVRPAAKAGAAGKFGVGGEHLVIELRPPP